jgi:hypothetical protein
MCISPPPGWGKKFFLGLLALRLLLAGVPVFADTRSWHTAWPPWRINVRWTNPILARCGGKDAPLSERGDCIPWGRLGSDRQGSERRIVGRGRSANRTCWRLPGGCQGTRLAGTTAGHPRCAASSLDWSPIGPSSKMVESLALSLGAGPQWPQSIGRRHPQPPPAEPAAV